MVERLTPRDDAILRWDGNFPPGLIFPSFNWLRMISITDSTVVVFIGFTEGFGMNQGSGNKWTTRTDLTANQTGPTNYNHPQPDVNKVFLKGAIRQPTVSMPGPFH
jgi:hypothetical protein